LDDATWAGQVQTDERNDDVDLQGSSILDVYLSGEDVGGVESELISKLQQYVCNGEFRMISLTLTVRSNPNHETLIPAILSLLSSSDVNDVISGQLAELVGFENLDLVMELLENREANKQIVRCLPLRVRRCLIHSRYPAI
jgi:hypothetical protein